MTKKNVATFAAIHLGSELISLKIIEYTNLNKMNVLEEAVKRVRLGEETFKSGKISFSTIQTICDILNGYKRLMTEYGVSKYVLQATTAVREASNQTFFINQIQVKTGLKIEVVDMPREIYTKFTSVIRTLGLYEKQAAGKGILYLDISSGGLGIVYFKDGAIKYQQNLHIGVVRIKEAFDRNQRSSVHFSQALDEYIASNIGPVKQEMGKEPVDYLVLTGSETKLILKMIDKTYCPNKVAKLEAAKFSAFYDRVRKLNIPQLIKVFNIDEESAEMVLPSIILYQQLLNITPAENIIVPPDRFIDGMKVLYVAGVKDKKFINKLTEMRLSLVRSIGERYHYDPDHAKATEKFAMVIFDSLKKSQGLDEQARLLLRAASNLHDIGKYVCLRSHTAYSYRLVNSTDIMGFSNQDKRIISLVTYYQGSLLSEHRMVDRPFVEKEILPLVAKLAAILRLADALDRSYRQKIKDCQVEVKGNELLVKVKSKEDLALEEWTFNNKANLFEAVFGLMPVIERG